MIQNMLFIIIYFISGNALASEPSIPLWVDIRDLVSTESNGKSFKVHSISKIIYDKLIKDPGALVPEGVVFEAEGPRGPEFSTTCREEPETAIDGSVSVVKKCNTIRAKENRSTRFSKVYGVEFSGDPVLFKNNDIFLVPINILFNQQADIFIFRKLEVTVNTTTKEIDVIRQMEIPMENTKFQVRVGIIQRKLILEDIDNGIKKIYPLGVGGIDEGVANQEKKYRILTPQHSVASLSSKYNYPEVVNPSYYKARPYIAVVNEKGERTSIAFHYKIDSQFNRGFVSHGCIRVRDKDLYELHYLIKNLKSIPLTMSYDIPDLEDHPYKLLNNKYQRVDLPVRKDKYGLLVTKWNNKNPPLDHVRSGYKPEVNTFAGMPSVEGQIRMLPNK